LEAVIAMSNTARKCLPDRRACETIALEFAGLHYTISLGRYSDRRMGEIFIANHKAGNAVDIAVRDAGILLSLLLQYGCPAETIARALSRNSDGSASGVIGAVLDLARQS
jgi:hypothetical protein